MIIRKEVKLTLEASPLNSRGYAVPPDRWIQTASTLKGSPIHSDGSHPCARATPSGSMYLPSFYPQVVPTYGYWAWTPSASLSPTVCLHYRVIVDHHKIFSYGWKDGFTVWNLQKHHRLFNRKLEKVFFELLRNRTPDGWESERLSKSFKRKFVHDCETFWSEKGPFRSIVRLSLDGKPRGKSQIFAHTPWFCARF